jgi:hypothetical protein
MCFCKKIETSARKAKEQKLAPSSPSFDENKYLLKKENDPMEFFDITKSSLYKRRYNKNGKKSEKN